MNKNKLKLWPFVLLTIVLIVCFLTSAWLFKWWGWILPWQILTISSVAIGLALLISSVCYWLVKKNRTEGPSAEQLSERERVKAIQRNISKLFDRVNNRTNHNGNSYIAPWYLLLCDSSSQARELLLSQDLEPADTEPKDDMSPISFWSSDTTVVVAIEDFDSPYFDESIEYLLQRFAKRRSRQAVNGVLMALSTEQLLQQQQSHLNHKANRWRNLLGRCNKAMGLNLPCYTLVTDFSALADLQRMFSCFDDDRLEQPLGALAEPEAAGFDEQWFDASFIRIQTELIQHTTRGLKAQLNPEYRDSILRGPYQFNLLKVELGDFLRQLFGSDSFTDQSLNYRGYFFCNIGAQAGSIDKLTMLMAGQLGYQQWQKGTPEQGRLLFNKVLLKSAIIPEAALVGVNPKREGRYRLLGWTFSSILILGVVAVIVLLKYNHDYYTNLNNQALAKLSEYRENLLANPPNPDDLTSPLFSVSDLRKIREIYITQKPWYIVAGVPNPSIEKAVEASYQKSLQQILLTALRDYLLKDMFVFNKLGDKLKTIELYNLYQLLFNPQRNTQEPLVEYYISSLQAEGESDIRTITRFRLILADALQPGVVPQQGEQALVNIVKASLSQDDISDLLYELLLRRPQMSQRIDLRQSLGQKAQTVFSYGESDSAFLIPRIFTREGFEQLLDGDDFNLATRAINDFEGVVGKVTSASQISRVNRELKQRYISDYISHWQHFYRNVSLQSAEDNVELRNQLKLVADTTFSPLKKLQSLVNYHTSLIDLSQSVAADPSIDPAAEPVATTPQEQIKEERNEIVRSMALDIARPFERIHRLLSADDQGLTPIDIALQQIDSANQWLDIALAEDPSGAGLLQQLSTTAEVNPLQEMQTLAGSFNDPLISGYLRNTAQRLNEVAMLEVRTFLNDEWRRNVYDFYKSQLAGFYPFKKEANSDVSQEDFNEFFAVDGKVDRFSSQFLGYFNLDEVGQRNMRSFLTSSSIPFNNELSRFLVAVKDIQQRVYSAGDMKVEFAIRAQDMSAKLSELALQSERRIYRYRNGPLLWVNVQWPQLQQQSEDIELQLKTVDENILRVSFVGFWSWFKLADALNARMLDNTSTSLLKVENKGQSVSLLLRVNNGKTPFTSGYFSQLSLPSAL
jgi:type VI secretion system protein ImpL